MGEVKSDGCAGAGGFSTTGVGIKSAWILVCGEPLVQVGLLLVRIGLLVCRRGNVGCWWCW